MNKNTQALRPKVAGIGEILWDIFPEGKRLGGAPANFCYITHALGAEAYPVSATGTDPFGAEIRQILENLGLSTEFIAIDPYHETGRVEVTLSGKGVPDYLIKENVAWDFIQLNDPVLRLAGELDAVCFGTLAQRDQISRKTIQTFIEKVPSDKIRLLDINLRLSYYNAEIIDQSLKRSNWLKLNHEELDIISALFGFSGSEDNLLQNFRDRYRLQVIALTLGANGSRLITGETDHRLDAKLTDIEDTVGAGDGFSAALVTAALAGLPYTICHEKAAEMASFLCQHPGATPPVPTAYRLV